MLLETFHGSKEVPTVLTYIVTMRLFSKGCKVDDSWSLYLLRIKVGRLPDHALDPACPTDDLVNRDLFQEPI